MRSAPFVLIILLSLATGRQRGEFSEISYGKSYTEIWILRGGIGGGPPSSPPVPPLQDPDLCTPGSMNSLFSDFIREFPRGILGVFGTVQGDLGRFLVEKVKEIRRTQQEHYTGTNPEKSQQILFTSSQ